jgi:N-acetylglucosamine kinase-like BadF-type ATPase
LADGAAAVLAIDGGNSKTDVALVAWDGSVLAALRGPGASHEAYGIDGAMDRLGEMIRDVAAKAGLADADRTGPGGAVARHLSACLAGADLPEEEQALTAALLARGWSESAVALNDTFAILRGGVDAPGGVAVTCGSGINCVAVAPSGAVARYLSFGTLTGDWGGGILEARNPLLLAAIDRELAVVAPGATARVLDAPPVAGAALLGLDHVGAPAEAGQRLRDGYRAARMADR